MTRMTERLTGKWPRLKEAMNRQLPEWLDLPARGCCLVTDCLTVLGLLGGAVWLVKRAAEWLR